MNSACQSCVSVDGHSGQYRSRTTDGGITQTTLLQHYVLFSASHVSDLPNFNKATFLTFAVTVNCVENRQLSAFQWSLARENRRFFTVFFFARSSPPEGWVGSGVGARGEGKLLLATLIFGCSVTVMCRVMSGWYRPVICVTHRLSGAGLGVIYSAGSCAVYSVYWPRRSHGSGHGPADSLSWLSTTKKPLGCQNPAHKSNQLVSSSWQLSGSYPRHPDLYHE